MENEIVISGSSGLIGRKLTKFLADKGFLVKCLERRMVYLPPDQIAPYLKNSYAVIHLSGANILRRWTESNKKLIYDSRVVTTRNIAEAIESLPSDERPACFISASAIGIYKTGKLHTESSNDFSDSFLGKTVKDWELASENIPVIRRIVFRMGLVLDKDALIIRKMLIPFKLGLGGRIGNGKQPFPFIHLCDLLNAFHNAIKDSAMKGTFNLVAPDQITNRDFVKEFAHKLKRPAFTIVPDWILKLIFGKASEILLKSPSVVPERLLKQGFSFKYPTVHAAINQIIQEIKDQKGFHKQGHQNPGSLI